VTDDAAPASEAAVAAWMASPLPQTEAERLMQAVLQSGTILAGSDRLTEAFRLDFARLMTLSRTERIVRSSWLQQVRAEAGGLPDRGIIDRLTAPVVTAQSRQIPDWIVQHKVLIVLLLILAIALSEPAIAAAMPPELRDLLAEEHGPLAYAMAIDATIVGYVAIKDSKKD
jgi:hypothetical protein